MKLIIFGSTGTIGHHLVEQSLAQGHTVKAFARNPSSLNITHPKLLLVAGDVFDPQAVSDAVKGCDAVLITLGSSKLSGHVRSQGTQNIVNAMQQHHIKRLICQTTLGAGDSNANLNFYWKYLMFGLLLRAVFKDYEAQEEIVKNTNLDWIIVRPGSFTDSPPTRAYKHGFSVTDKLQLKISRPDVADFMLKQLSENTYLHQSPGLSY
jgi:putative NADH-flavin reductase